MLGISEEQFRENNELRLGHEWLMKAVSLKMAYEQPHHKVGTQANKSNWRYGLRKHI